MNLALVVAGIAVWEIPVMAAEGRERAAKFYHAQKAADKMGKPLLVVGGPYGSVGLRAWLRVPAHGPGDVCYDMDPAACRGAPVFKEGDARALPFGDRQFGAAFCSHLLEHMPDLDGFRTAVGELMRVADHVFVCVPPKHDLYAWIVPGHRLWVRQSAYWIEAERMWTGEMVRVATEGRVR